MLGTRGIPVEQSAQEGDQRNTLQRGPPVALDLLRVGALEGAEPVGVAKRLGGERRDHLAEPDVALREWGGSPLGAQEDRANDVCPPTDRNDHDGAHVASVQRIPYALERRFTRCVGDEDGLSGLERALQFRVTAQVNDEVSQRGILEGRHHADFLGHVTGQVDRASIEPEQVAQPLGDALQDLREVQRRAHLLEDVHRGRQLVPLARQLLDTLAEQRDVGEVGNGGMARRCGGR